VQAAHAGHCKSTVLWANVQAFFLLRNCVLTPTLMRDPHVSVLCWNSHSVSQPLFVVVVGAVVAVVVVEVVETITVVVVVAANVEVVWCVEGVANVEVVWCVEGFAVIVELVVVLARSGTFMTSQPRP